ncbi:MAG: hypothetical protein K2P30_03840, partial [Lachnospiraceae bacterium]|nr:hypothetical protein [Lachnospiraceae bacterium]
MGLVCAEQKSVCSALCEDEAVREEMMEERAIDRFMFQRVRIGKIQFQIVDLTFILCLFAFAFMIRWKLMPVESADYWGFLEGWMTQIRNGGGVRSLSQSISNYTAPYM